MTTLVATVRPRTVRDLPGIQSLMRRVYPPPHGPESVWSEENLLSHLHRFPEGQFVAEGPAGRLIGAATSARFPLRRALEPHTWWGITGGGSLATHDAEGYAFYGVDIAVDPAWQGLGVGRLLYEARIALARRGGCLVFVAGARIPGYHEVAGQMTPEAYVAKVVKGERFDPTLSKQLSVGFEVLGVLRNYARDPETLGHAAHIVLWL
ncbi:MAG TPA: GNAT family N-acetyltransferase [Holophagaceae bacterium]|nr:GNAT family N-acetyltransferase [Holophagaceae bacterium]